MSAQPADAHRQPQRALSGGNVKQLRRGLLPILAASLLFSARTVFSEIGGTVQLTQLDYLMKYFLVFLPFAFAISGCDAIGTPVATITGVDVAINGADEFVEIQDVSGRAYARIESFPASVDIPLYSEARDYFVVVIRPASGGGFEFVAASETFKAVELTGSSFITGGNVEAVLTLE